MLDIIKYDLSVKGERMELTGRLPRDYPETSVRRAPAERTVTAGGGQVTG